MVTRATFVFGACVLTLLAQAPASDRKASIEGFAVDASTGEPLRKAFVKIWRRGRSDDAIAQALSGPDGRFRIPVVEPGEYTVHAERSGYLDCDRCMSVTTAAGQGVTGVRIALTRYGAISGRVVDADGDPWTWGSVSLYRLSWKQGRKQLDQEDGVEIDDRGEFHVGKLAAGRYFVEADPGRQSPHVPVAYVTTFYPAALDPSGAARIDLRPGQEVTGVEIKLQSAETHRISVRVDGAISSSSRQRAGGSMLLDISRISGPFETRPDLASGDRPDGTFEFNGVIDGTYRLRVGSMARGAYPPDSGPLGEAIIQVAGHDVDDVRIEAAAPRRLVGSVHVEEADRPDWASCSVFLQREDYNAAQPLDENGGFNFPTVAGSTYRVHVRTPAVGKYYLKEIRAGSAEFHGSLLDTTRLGDSPVEILLSGNPARIRGMIQAGTNSDKPDTARITVLLVPDTEDADSRESEAMPATFDEKGAFSVVGVPPGDYRLFAWLDLPEDAWKDEDFWNAMKDKGERVKLAEGDQKSIDLPLISPSETAALLARLDIQ